MISVAVRLLVLVVLVLVAAASNASAQSSCPSVSVSCVGTNCYEPPFFFLASVANADPTQKISFEWTVANGQIVAGQGTWVIKVVSNRVNKTFYRDGKLVTEVWAQGDVTASVKLIGAPPECTGTTASISYIDERGMVLPPKVVEEFGNVSANEMKRRLDSFANHLRTQPGATAYIVSEGRWSQAKRAMDYLVGTKGIDDERITYVSKSRTKRVHVKLYVVPAGSLPPH